MANSAFSILNFKDLNSQAIKVASTSPEIDFNDFIDSTFFDYEINFEFEPSNDDVNLYLRCSTDNGSSFDTGNNYSYVGRTIIWNTSAVTEDDTVLDGDSRIQIMADGSNNGCGNASNEGCSGFIKVTNPSATRYTRFNGMVNYTTANGYYASCYFSGTYNSTTAVNSLRLLPDAGTFSVGTFRIKGVR